MLDQRFARRALATGLALAAASAIGCAGKPATSRITFVTAQPTATLAGGSNLGAGWSGATLISSPTTFLALGAGDRLGTQVRTNDYVIAMGLQQNQTTQLADVPVTQD
jgi:hypothetical protein